MSQLYRIKLLKWEQYTPYGSMIAHYAFNLDMRVFQVIDGEWYHTSPCNNGNTVGSFKTAESAMKAAEKAYIKQLQQVLEEVSL